MNGYWQWFNGSKFLNLGPGYVPCRSEIIGVQYEGIDKLLRARDRLAVRANAVQEGALAQQERIQHLLGSDTVSPRIRTVFPRYIWIRLDTCIASRYVFHAYPNVSHVSLIQVTYSDVFSMYSELAVKIHATIRLQYIHGYNFRNTHTIHRGGVVCPKSREEMYAYISWLPNWASAHIK